MDNKVMVNGQYVRIEEPNVHFGPNVFIHGNNVKINGRYIGLNGTKPGLPPELMPQTAPQVVAPDVWVNGVNVGGNPAATGVNPSINTTAGGKK